ncbi:hypothetical protein [Agromyces marinus]|nr:hypothetical protein [Agromyces marinus]
MPASSAPTSRPGRMPQRAALAALACALLIGTTACAVADEPGGEPRSAPPAETADGSTAEPTAEPIFASDEEALAAAVEAYEAYSAASNRVANAGGEGSGGIARLVSPEFDEVVQEEFAALRDSGLRMSGDAIHFAPVLDSHEERNRVATVTVTFCRDVSGTRLLRPDGSDATPADRDLIQATNVVLTSVERDSATLIVSSARRVQDESNCQ